MPASGISITTLPAPMLQAVQLRGQSDELAAELLDVLLLSEDEGSLRSWHRQRSASDISTGGAQHGWSPPELQLDNPSATV